MAESVDTYPELSLRAAILGLIQGVILNLAFVYSALKLGFSIGGSEVAAIMGYALLRGLFRNGTVLENNINQTIASGINTAGAGIVFTFPALFLIHSRLQAEGKPGLDFTLWPYMLSGAAGAVLGNILIIPLRKQMIEIARLRFPSGIATATIIRSGATGLEKAKLLVLGVCLAGLWKALLLSEWLFVPGVFADEEFNFSFGLLPAFLSPVISLSLMNIAAGMLAGRGGLPLLYGGMLAWWIVSPLAWLAGWSRGNNIAEETNFIYSQLLRPLGIGVLIGGALMSVVLTYPAIRAAWKALQGAQSNRRNDGAENLEELPFRILVYGGCGALGVFFLATAIIPGVQIWQAVLGSALGTVWLGLGGLIVAQSTGMTNISPLSGMALIAITLMMFIFDQNVMAAMVIGVAVCVAIGKAADMMQDLKTGFLLGARPAAQQLSQFAFSWIGAIVGILAVSILWRNGANESGGFGPGTLLPAPQAGVLVGIFQSLAAGTIPVDKYVLGAGIGALLSCAPAAGLGVLIGLAIYLPFAITLGYGLGCLLTIRILRSQNASFYDEKIVPFAAGLIVGEALVGVGHAALVIASGSPH